MIRLVSSVHAPLGAVAPNLCHGNGLRWCGPRVPVSNATRLDSGGSRPQLCLIPAWERRSDVRLPARLVLRDVLGSSGLRAVLESGRSVRRPSQNGLPSSGMDPGEALGVVKAPRTPVLRAAVVGDVARRRWAKPRLLLPLTAAVRPVVTPQNLQPHLWMLTAARLKPARCNLGLKK